jgi:hypothetical protein
MRLGDETTELPAGSFVCVPPGVVHTFSNPGEAPVRFLNFNTPAGWENYMRDLAAALAKGTPARRRSAGSPRGTTSAWRERRSPAAVVTQGPGAGGASAREPLAPAVDELRKPRCTRRAACLSSAVGVSRAGAEALAWCAERERPRRCWHPTSQGTGPNRRPPCSWRLPGSRRR